MSTQAPSLIVEPSSFGVEALPAFVLYQAEFTTRFRQTQVRIVLSQLKPVLRARREHSVRFGHTAGHQVVDHHANVGLITTWSPRRQPFASAPRVEPRHQSLAGRLFITCGAVDLTRKE